MSDEQSQLDRIEGLSNRAASDASKAREYAQRALSECERINGSVTDLHEIIWGRPEERQHGPAGIKAKVDEMYGPWRDMRALYRAAAAIIGLLGITGVIAIVRWVMMIQ